MGRDNHWSERARHRKRQNSNQETTRSNSVTNETLASPPSTSPESTSFDHSLESASPHSTSPGTPAAAGSPERSFASIIGSDASAPPSIPSAAVSPDQFARRRNSSFGDKYIGVGSLFAPIGHQRAPGRLGRKSFKKQARGPRIKPERCGVLEKDTTRKLTKFWNIIEAADQEGCFESFHPERSDPEAPSELPTLPEISCGSLDIKLPSIDEDTSEVLTLRSSLYDMDTSRLAPGPFENPKKDKVKDAQDMYQKVLRNAEKAGCDPPPYDFIELIGKGSFGRVYKCRDKNTGEIVAIKIADVDDTDYQGFVEDRSDAIDSFSKEVDMLLQLKEDSRARNILKIFDAFDFHSQLWIISEYCTGGSIRTLKKAVAAMTKRQGLEEHFLIPLARELMIAIKSVHDIGVIHRDLKCANVYVTEDGEVRLGDFGIVGEHDPQSKRKTVIGTPNFMAPEMVAGDENKENAPGYDTKADIWSYGCTVYEMATGVQPLDAVHPRQLFKAVMESAPRLEGGEYSQELRDFVAFCCNPDVEERPTAEEVLKHPFIADSSKKYPTSNLVRLVEQYTLWEYKGGQRQSLFAPGGAPAPGYAEEQDVRGEDDAHDWNFSTSDTFNAAFGQRYSQVIATQDFAKARFGAPGGPVLPPLNTKDLTPFERIQEQHRQLSADRGERSLERLWNPDAKPYEMHTPDDPHEEISDLPLRSMSSNAPMRESLIDLDTAGGLDMSIPTFNFDFGDVPTLKARASRQVPQDDEDEEDDGYGTEDRIEKRVTLDWKFPSEETKRATLDWTFPRQKENRSTVEWTFRNAEPAEPDDLDKAMELPPPGTYGQVPPGFRPTLKHTTTEPIGQFGDFVHPAQQQSAPQSGSPVRDSMRSMIDLDMGLADPSSIMRPSTASSATGSTMTDMTSGNPFDLEEDPEQNEIDRNRFSYHKQWQSEGGQLKRRSHKMLAMHSRGSSLTDPDFDLDHQNGDSSEDALEYDYIAARKAQESGRTPLLVADPVENFDTSHWPDFSPDSGLDEEPTYPPHHLPRLGDPDFPLQQGLRTNGLSAPSLSRSHDGDRSCGPQRELEFREPSAPRSDALREDAEPQSLAEEMDRVLDDFEDTLMATSRALCEHTGLGNDEESEEGSGMESGNAPTGDEGGF